MSDQDNNLTPEQNNFFLSVWKRPTFTVSKDLDDVKKVFELPLNPDQSSSLICNIFDRSPEFKEYLRENYKNPGFEKIRKGIGYAGAYDSMYKAAGKGDYAYLQSLNGGQSFIDQFNSLDKEVKDQLKQIVAANDILALHAWEEYHNFNEHGLAPMPATSISHKPVDQKNVSKAGNKVVLNQ